MEGEETIPFEVFQDLRNNYIRLLKDYRSLKNKYDVLIKPEEIVAEWTQEDKIKAARYPGWEYIKPFSQILTKISIQHPQLIRILGIAHVAEDEFRNVMAQAKNVREICESDATTQTPNGFGNLDKISVEIQTSPEIYEFSNSSPVTSNQVPTVPELACSLNLESTPENDLNLTSSHYSSTESIEIIDVPIYRSNFFKANPRPMSKKNKNKEESKIPSLFEIKFDAPTEIDESTIKWYKETARQGCWKCGSSLHKFNDCDEHQTQIFCYNCGEPGVTKLICPDCPNKKKKYTN